MSWHNRSLRFRLVSILSVSAVFIWIISTALAWWQVRKEVSDVFDAQQILFAQRLASSDLRNILLDHHHKPEKHKHKKPR